MNRQYAVDYFQKFFLFKHALWLQIWSILKKVSCIVDSNVHSVVVGRNIVMLSLLVQWYGLTLMFAWVWLTYLIVGVGDFSSLYWCWPAPCPVKSSSFHFMKLGVLKQQTHRERNYENNTFPVVSKKPEMLNSQSNKGCRRSKHWKL